MQLFVACFFCILLVIMIEVSNAHFKKAVFFDVDGTLSDSFRLGFDSTNIVLKRNEVSEITEEDYHFGARYPTPRRLAWHVTKNPDDPIGEKLGQQFDDLYVGLVSKETTPFYDGVYDLINFIKGQQNVGMGVLSNACGAYVRAVVKTHSIEEKFAVKLGADDVAAAKPSPDGLFACCKHLALPPESCIYVGDSPTDGMAASSAGMKSIGVTWGSNTRAVVEPHFTTTVETVIELKAHIEKFLREP